MYLFHTVNVYLSWKVDYIYLVVYVLTWTAMGIPHNMHCTTPVLALEVVGIVHGQAKVINWYYLASAQAKMYLFHIVNAYLSSKVDYINLVAYVLTWTDMGISHNMHCTTPILAPKVVGIRGQTMVIIGIT